MNLLPSQSQVGSSAQSHMHATLSSGGFPKLLQQTSHLTMPAPKLLETKSNYTFSTTHPSQLGYEHMKSFGSSPVETIANSTNERRSTRMPDIIFAYADVMMKKLKDGEEAPLKDNECLQPDLMYDLIMRKVRESRLNLTVKKTPLNKKILL